MKNRTMLAILTLAALALSPGFAYLSGWASDKHCTAEEEGRGECNRHSDGANYTFAWLQIAAMGIAISTGLFALALSITWVTYLFSKPSDGGYGSGKTLADWMAKERGT